MVIIELSMIRPNFFLSQVEKEEDVERRSYREIHQHHHLIFHKQFRFWITITITITITVKKEFEENGKHQRGGRKMNDQMEYRIPSDLIQILR